MKRSKTGEYEITTGGGENVRAFVPHPLPPRPPLDVAVLYAPLEKAALWLGRLDGVSHLLPAPHTFLYSYVRKEAVLSSQIEGTQSSLSDLLLFEVEEAPGALLDDVVEVSNYVAAMEHGLERMRGGFPLCRRLICEVHAKLLEGGRGDSKDPEEFRRSQNWIGGSRPGTAHFVPPPVHRVADCMSALEKFIHAPDSELSALLRAGLAHAQFETIHPFLDGNGRIGRLLISLMLWQDAVLRAPLLYLSLYFKQNQRDYYALLGEVRRTGDWEAWLKFFLEGVAQTAQIAVSTVQRLLSLFGEDKTRIEKQAGRAARSALRVHQALGERPVASLGSIVNQTGLSFPTVANAMKTLARLEIVRELTGRRRSRLFCCARYLSILNEGTETPPDGAD